MKREQLIEWARMAGYDMEKGERIGESSDRELFERFAALVAAHEREQCALVCESTTEYGALDEYGETKAYASAEAIRARGEVSQNG